MTRVGVAIAEAVRPEREPLLRALDAWAERSRMPDIVPLWSRRSQSPDGTHWHVDPTLLDALHERQVEPVLYVESTGARYPDILTGLHDDELRLLACRADGHVVRWDQEPDGDFGQAWASHPLYVDVYRHISHVLRSEADVRLMWCPVEPGKAAKAGYWPGIDSVGVIGFDRYSWAADTKLPEEQWAGPIGACGRIAPGLPILVGECGRLAGLPRRAEWLRSIAATGVDAVVMDMSVPGFEHDWRWTPAMYRAFAGMVA